MASRSHPARDPAIPESLARRRSGLWDGRAGKILFWPNPADDLIYFGRARERDQKVKLTLGIWNGAATGSGTYQLVVSEKKEVGGYHVRRVS